MAPLNRRYHSLFLLSSVLLFFVATPFLETRAGGETLVVLNLYLTLVAATVTLSERRKPFLSAIPIGRVHRASLAQPRTPRRWASPAGLA